MFGCMVFGVILLIACGVAEYHAVLNEEQTFKEWRRIGVRNGERVGYKLYR